MFYDLEYSKSLARFIGGYLKDNCFAKKPLRKCHDNGDRFVSKQGKGRYELLVRISGDNNLSIEVYDTFRCYKDKALVNIHSFVNMEHLEKVIYALVKAINTADNFNAYIAFEFAQEWEEHLVVTSWAWDLKTHEKVEITRDLVGNRAILVV